MKTSDRIIDATLRLLEAHPFDRVTVHAIADEAGVGLAELNAAFATRGEILDAFVRRIDAEVLAGGFEDMADEPPRERLFDVLMTRLDALRPHRAALRSLMRSARRDPALALALNGFSVRSQVWMLAAAGIDAAGLRGSVAVQALSLSFLRVLRIFLEEDDPGMPRTMAALDQELRRAESRHNRLARWVGPAIRSRTAPAAAEPDAGGNGADHDGAAAFARTEPMASTVMASTVMASTVMASTVVEPAGAAGNSAPEAPSGDDTGRAPGEGPTDRDALEEAGQSRIPFPDTPPSAVRSTATGATLGEVSADDGATGQDAPEADTGEGPKPGH